MQSRGSKQAQLRRLSDAWRVTVKFTSDFQPLAECLYERDQVTVRVGLNARRSVQALADFLKMVNASLKTYLNYFATYVKYELKLNFLNFKIAKRCFRFELFYLYTVKFYFHVHL